MPDTNAPEREKCRGFDIEHEIENEHGLDIEHEHEHGC
jgi:hypothetical protein